MVEAGIYSLVSGTSRRRQQKKYSKIDIMHYEAYM